MTFVIVTDTDPLSFISNEHGRTRYFTTAEDAISYAGPRLESEKWMVMGAKEAGL